MEQRHKAAAGITGCWYSHVALDRHGDNFYFTWYRGNSGIKPGNVCVMETKKKAQSVRVYARRVKVFEVND